MIIGIEEFLRRTQRYMALAEKMDLFVVDRNRSVMWHIHCRNGSLWDRLADGVAGLLGDNTYPQHPLQNRMAS